MQKNETEFDVWREKKTFCTKLIDAKFNIFSPN